jgi:hypothetical protein
LHISLIYQPQVGLVDERRGLQRVTGALAIHLASGHPPQLRINQGHQLVEGSLVTIAPGVK